MKKLTSPFVIKLLLSGLLLFDFSSANAAQTLSQPLDNLPSASQMKGTVLGQCVYGGYCNGTSTKTAYNGITYMTDVGSPVYAVCDGTVKKAQRADRFMVIDHSNCGGFASLFAYYGNIDLGIFKTGSTVKAGDQIGTVAKSKNGGALHLSFNKSYVTSSLAYTPIGKTTLKDCTQESVTQRRTALDAKGYLDPILVGSQSSWNPVLLKGGDAKTGCEATEQLFTSQTSPYSPFVTAAKSALNDTGITTCSNASSNGLACPVSGFPNQDAQVGRDKTKNDDSDGYAGFSFTKISSSGATLAASATSWNCVKDNVTGLMWENKTTDGGLHDWNHTYTWYEPDNTKNGGSAGTQNGGSCKGSDCDTNAYVKAVNAAGYCGYKDWRLPTFEELLSIVNLDTYNPAIDINYFPSTQSSVFWSSSPYASSSSNAWYVYFDYGYSSSNYKDYNNLVRLVR